MKVSFNDLQKHHAPFQAELDEAILKVVRSGHFVAGPKVAEFEERFAEFCETDHCVAVSDGTDALWLALLALGVGPGDEVITVPNTYVATVEAIMRSGATPVFVDVDARMHLMNPELLEAAITSRTAAIIPVHLFGQPAPLTEIRAIAAKHGLAVVEDAAQAHGAKYRGRRIGGEIACFSFYPGKNLGALGEAGAITVNDSDLAERLRMMRNHGQTGKARHDFIGWNSRMDELQAAALLVKLPYLDGWNRRRQDIAKSYAKGLLAVPGLITPDIGVDGSHVFHVFSLIVDDRDEMRSKLEECGIATGCHYPTPVHMQPAYKDLGYHKGDFPIVENLAKKLLSLPLFPELSTKQVHYVIEQVSRFSASRPMAFEA